MAAPRPAGETPTMRASDRNAAIAYALATVVLTLYGVEVCPYIEDLGHRAIAPIFVGGFVALGVEVILVELLHPL